MLKKTLISAVFFILLSCTNINSKNTLNTQLDDLFSKEFPNSDEPGGSILVKKGNSIVYMKSYGVADLSTKEKITENTVFNTGSISKTFVANAILILEQQNLLSLDDSLSKYFNDFKNNELAEKVTIKHMLSHTSGLPDLRKVSENLEFYLTAKDVENFSPLKNTVNLNFEPGEKFEYSNPSFNGLALIIEKLAKQPWQDFIKENLFIPSDMNNSTITNGTHPQSGVAHAYRKDKNDKYIEYDYGEFPTFAAAGNGGVWSTVLDLAKYESALQNNIFLNKDLIELSRKPVKFDNWSDQLSPPTIGHSWFTDEEYLFGSRNDFPVNFVFHTGGQGGFRAFHITIPEKDILYIALFNRPPSDFDQLVKDSIAIFENNNWLE